MKPIYIFSDSHLGHNKMLEYCNRPKDFTEQIIKNLFALPDNCILIHLGDICIGQDKKWHDTVFSKLPYTKWLVKGNHDSHKSNSFYLSNGWDFVCDYFVWKVFNHKVLFSHIPLPKNTIPDFNFDCNIHGHFHNAKAERWEEYLKMYYDNSFHKLFACEYTNYKPILLEKFITNWEKSINEKQ